MKVGDHFKEKLFTLIEGRGLFGDRMPGYVLIQHNASPTGHIQFKVDKVEELIVELKKYQRKVVFKKNENRFYRGQKVRLIKDGKIYDYGYMGQDGNAIIYDEGEENMQDAMAVNFEELQEV